MTGSTPVLLFRVIYFNIDITQASTHSLIFYEWKRKYNVTHIFNIISHLCQISHIKGYICLPFWHIPAYLTYMQSTSCKMPRWINHKLESRLLGETSTISDMQMIRSNGRKQRRTKESLDESERGEWKSGLKLNIKKTKIVTSGSITSWQIEGEKLETVTDFIFLGSKITVDSECSHEIKRCSLLGKKSMTNLDSILKSRDITLLTKFHIVKPVFSRSHVQMWELDHKESWAPKNWCFWTVVLEKTVESPLNCKEIQPVHPKGNQPWTVIGRTDAETEAPILWPPDVKSQLIGKDPDAGKDWRQKEKRRQRMS